MSITPSQRSRKNQIRRENGCVFILLPSGVEAVLDESDFRLVEAGNWHELAKNHTSYCRGRFSGSPKKFLLHRVILQAKDGVIVDHVNGNGLDNRRANLREADHSSNNCNKRVQSNNTSGVKGTYLCRKTGLWIVRIKHHGKRFPVGRFATLEECKVAYSRAATVLFGTFARPE